MFVALFALPETLPAHKRAQGSLLESFANYLKLLRNRKFMLHTLSVTSFYVSNYAFITGSPFVYIDYFGVEPADYGFLFGINILGIVLMSVINRRLVNHLSLERLLLRANLIASLSALVLLGLVALQWGGIWGVLVPIFFVFAMNGIISACANAVALNSVPNQMAGSASALLGSLQYGSGIISSLLLAFFSNGSPMPMASIIASFVLLGLGLGLSWWGKKG